MIISGLLNITCENMNIPYNINDVIKQEIIVNNIYIYIYIYIYLFLFKLIN